MIFTESDIHPLLLHHLKRSYKSAMKAQSPALTTAQFLAAWQALEDLWEGDVLLDRSEIAPTGTWFRNLMGARMDAAAGVTINGPLKAFIIRLFHRDRWSR